MSFEPQVIADSSEEWVGNSLRFATYKEAEDYVKDLAVRWFAVKQIQVVESKDPVNSMWTGKKSISCADAC